MLPSTSDARHTRQGCLSALLWPPATGRGPTTHPIPTHPITKHLHRHLLFLQNTVKCPSYSVRSMALPSEGTQSVSKPMPLTLLQLLSNTLVVYQTAPYLPISALLALGATSQSFKFLIYNTPGFFQYLDLSNNKFAQCESPPTLETILSDITDDEYVSSRSALK